MFQYLLRFKRWLTVRLRSVTAQLMRSPKFPRWQMGFQLSIGVMVVVLIAVLFPAQERILSIDLPGEGDIAANDVIAEFDFPVTKSPEELGKERRRARAEAPPVLSYDLDIRDSVLRLLADFFDQADVLAYTAISPELRRERLTLAYPWLDAVALPPPDSGAAWLGARATIEDAIRRFYVVGLFPQVQYVPKSEGQFVVVAKPSGDLPVKRSQILDLEGAMQRLHRELAEIPALEDSTRLALEPFLRSVIAANLEFDPDETARRQAAAEEQILPHKVMIFKGERIVRRNHRVTAAHAERLKAYAAYRFSQQRETHPLLGIVPWLLHILAVTFCVTAVGVFLWVFRRRYLRKSNVVILCGLLWAVTIVTTWYAVRHGAPAAYLAPLPLAAVIVAVLVDLATALASSIFLGVTVGIVLGFDLSAAFIGMTAGIVSAFSVRTVRHRYDFYRPVLYGGITYALLIYLFETLKNTELGAILEFSGLGILNALVGAIVALFFLPVFESLLGFTTDLTLLELSDLNHPLLKRLALEAPGTYHHSIVIGNLAEKAAESIGANALLTRVGSYFHDVGKMEKPEYFVENQRHLKSKHEKLSPSMSALILESHVKTGRDMAEEYNLPDSIIDFIEQHHGTTTMTFFYQKALRRTEDSVAEDEFRYPGPKPQSRETAIVMLADSTEAVSRTLDDPKPGRLRGAVQKIIETKFTAGQLDECDLTLRDLRRIENAFVQILIGVFHSRIDYPSGEKDEPEAAATTVGLRGVASTAQQPVADVPKASANGGTTQEGKPQAVSGGGTAMSSRRQRRRR